jgi:hypothetical protein
MTDNTQLPPGTGGDTIRTLDKTGTGLPKTEVVAIDLGGGDGRSENILTFPIPTAPDIPSDDDSYPTLSLSPNTMDALETLFRQLMAAVLGPQGAPGPPLSVAVGVASVLAAQANSGRKGMVVTNTSTSGQVISLGLGFPAVAAAGIVLQPNNYWWMDVKSFTTGQINAIASAASGSVAVQEFN